MLHSNFGAIVKARNDRKPILELANYVLFGDITTDPNDAVCEISSPITDIRNRFRVQTSLWETVLKLRTGQYYDSLPFQEFLTALNACRNNLYDNVDLAYNQDEGALLRKIMNVFSLRPTLIVTRPIATIASLGAGNSAGINPFMGMGMNVGNDMRIGTYGTGMAFVGNPVATITRIPMMTIQLPPRSFAKNDGVLQEEIHLKNATQQTVWINENKTIVPKENSIYHSNEVLIFYVNRRFQRVHIKTFANPLSFSQMPLTMTSFERLNDWPVVAPETLTLGLDPSDSYQLRSVVAVTETEIMGFNKKPEKIITGTTGLIMQHRDMTTNRYDNTYYYYDPVGAAIPREVRDDGKRAYAINKPISLIQMSFALPQEDGIVPVTFNEVARTMGTIYIYAKPQGYDITNGWVAY